MNQRTDFWLSVVHCIKATVPFLSESELVCPTDRPYNERYFANLEESAKIAQQFQAEEEKEGNDQDQGENEEHGETSHSVKQASTVGSAHTRARSVPMQLGHQLGERQEQEEQNTDRPVTEVEEIASDTDEKVWSKRPGLSNNQKPMQNPTSFSCQSAETGVDRHQSPNSQQLDSQTFKMLGHTQIEAETIPADPVALSRLTQTDSEPIPPTSAGPTTPSQTTQTGPRVDNIHGVQSGCLPLMGIQSVKDIYKTILYPLLQRPSLKDFRPLTLIFARRIWGPTIGTLQDLEFLLLSNARVSCFFFTLTGKDHFG